MGLFYECFWKATGEKKCFNLINVLVVKFHQFLNVFVEFVNRDMAQTLGKPKNSEVALLSSKYSGAGFVELQLITGNLNHHNLQYLQVEKNHYYYFMKLEI